MRHNLLATAVILTALISVSFAIPTVSLAQGIGGPQNLTLQLPTQRIFSVRTVVSVPDGGTISLAGGGTNAYARGSRGNFGPFARSPLTSGGKNSALAGGVWAGARVLSLRELEQDALDRLRQRNVNRKAGPFAKTKRDFNPPPAIARKANFLARNIGRTKK